MKKILSVLFIIFAVQLPGLTAITPEEAISDTYLINHGHSGEMSRLINLQYSQVNGKKPTYQRKEPEWYSSNKAVNFVRKTFMYFDCGLDDQKFMQHDIRYSTGTNDL